MGCTRCVLFKNSRIVSLAYNVLSSSAVVLYLFCLIYPFNKTEKLILPLTTFTMSRHDFSEKGRPSFSWKNVNFIQILAVLCLLGPISG